MRTYLISFAISLLVALVLTPLLRNWALKKNWVDDTGGRKIHKAPIPRLGGIAILIAMLIPISSLLFLDSTGMLAVLGTDSAEKLSHALWNDSLGTDKDLLAFLPFPSLLKSLLLGTAVIAFIGIWDDVWGIRARYKLMAQIVAASIVFLSGIQIEAISVPFFSVIHFPWWMSMGVTVFWVVLVINAINLIDGMDGLAGSVVVLAGTSLFVMSLLEANPLACLLLVVMVGATLGFLAYNLNPASIFLGDTGSMFLGFVLALASVHSSQKSYTLFSMVAAMMVMGLPIFDLSMAVLRRFLSGKSLFSPDQHHIHHLLLRKGFSQKQSIYVLFAVALGLEGLAFVSIYADDKLAALSILAVIPLGFLAVRFLGYNRIILHARRERLLESTERNAQARLTIVQRFRDSLLQLSNQEELQSALLQLAKDLGWKEYSLYHCDQRLFGWPEQSAQGVIHLQDLTERSYHLNADCKLVVYQLKENEVFSPHDTALQELIASHLREYLLLQDHTEWVYQDLG